ncbi:MAG: non-homologous end-joining DNA ligase [Thermotogota bacterium]
MKKKKQPDWISPMLATLTHDHFSHENWIYERKLDGERCLAFKSDKNLKLLSRNKKKLNSRYPEIIYSLMKMQADNYIIDGEIVAFDGNITSFSKLQERMHLTSKKEVKQSDVEVFYYIFDICYADGYDFSSLPLTERKNILKNLLSFNEPVRILDYQEKTGEKYLSEACKKGWEGLIAKKKDSEYIHSRSKKWLKFKCSKRQELIIVGYTEPQGERKGFGALLMGYYSQGKLVYAGKVGTGYTDDFLEQFSQRLRKIETKRSPLDNQEINEDDVHWVHPEMVGEVAFTEWTDSGKLRHPSFLGIREDKEPEQVVNEEERSKKEDV